MTSEAGGRSAFAVALRTKPSADVAISVDSSDVLEARPDVSRVVFTPANWDKPQTVTVTGVDDAVDDGDKVVTIALRAVVSADAAYAGIDPDDITLTNMDDEVPGVFASPPSPSNATTEKGAKITFTLQLRLPPAADVTVPVHSSNTAEGIVDKASVTFTKATWNVPQIITVSGVDDKIADPSTAYTVEAGPSASSDRSYDRLSANPTKLTNADDDDVAQLEIGGWQSCVRFVDGRVKCWGPDLGNGAQGYGDGHTYGDDPGEMGDVLPYVDLGAGRTAKFLATATYHTCAILDDDSLKCWGSNRWARLGLGDLVDRGVRPGQMGDALPTVDFGGLKVKSVSAKEEHTCAILSDDSLRCWGLQTDGRLGNSDPEMSARGDVPGEMGASLPRVELGAGRKAVAVSAGHFTSCAVLDDATVKCWGYGQAGWLGYGEDFSRGGSTTMGDALPAVKLGTGRKAKAVAVGERHACAILDNGSVKCWGDNASGQLGLGDTRTRGLLPTDMGDNLPAVDFGPGRTAKQIKAGVLHTCAILDDDSARCWGENPEGRLGQGDTINHGSGPGQMGVNLRPIDLGLGAKVTWIAAGLYSSGAITSKHAVKAWGGDVYGILGQGRQQIVGDQPGEMGDVLPPVLLVGP